MATLIDLGFNTFLSFGREWGRFGVVIPGLMGTPGATSWTLLGIALLLLSVSSHGSYQKAHVKARSSSAADSTFVSGHLVAFADRVFVRG
jgi:hypothetical protein